MFLLIKFTKGLTLENRVGAQYYNSSRDNKGDAMADLLHRMVLF
jgi:hypothetical protein